jgi:Bacterial Ig-like domain/FG-GAP-like repeat
MTLSPVLVLAQPTVIGLSPARNANAAPRPTNIALTFNQAISAASAGNVRVFSYQRGGQLNRPGGGTLSGGGTSTLTFNPTNDLQPGETVQVTVPPTVRSVGEVAARRHVYQFTAAAGSGPGTFSGTQEIPQVAQPLGVAVGDVDGDGDLDIVAANNNIHLATVRLNNGAGVFTLGQDVALASGSRALALGDLDGDGDLDLLTAGNGSTVASVNLNNGAGVFSGNLNVSVGLQPYAIALGDLDGDGDLDFAVCNNDGGFVSIRFNNGAGSFSGSATLTTGGLPQSVKFGDVDSDGDLDMLVLNQLDTRRSTVSICRNDGTGSFFVSQKVVISTINDTDFGYTLAVGDLDNDGDLDFVTANGLNSNTVSVRRNDGTGTFGSGSFFTVGGTPRSVILGDIDGDQDLDLLVSSDEDSLVRVRRNIGSGVFAVEPDVAIGGRVNYLALGDLDGDGDLDLVANNFLKQTTSVRFNQVGDLVISTPGQVIPGGTYRNITVTATGEGTLGGDVTVTGTLLVQAGGQLDDGCHLVTGPGAFTLAARAYLRICAPQGISASGATGAIQVSGVRTFSPHASYTYKGSVAQITGSGLPARAWELLSTNPAALTLSQPLSVRQRLSLSAGDLLLNAQALTLLSTADTTALVANLGVGRVLGNSATVQQYITPNPGPAVGYRFLSSPTANSTIADLTVPGPGGFTPIVNGLYNTSPNPTAVRPYPNVFGFDETRGGPTAPFATGYFSPTPAGQPTSQALTAPLVPGKGYSVAMPPLTVDFTGTLTSGNVTVGNLTRTGTPAPEGKPGYHLLGNPYPSPLVWDRVVPPAGMSSTIYVLKTLGGNNAVYLTRTTNGDGTGTGTLPNGVLAIAQGFFAQVTGAGPVDFTFTNALRAVNPVQAAHYRAAAPRPTLSLTLRSTEPATPAEAQDEAFFVFLPTTAQPARGALLTGQRPGRNRGVPTLATRLPGGEEQAITGLPLAWLAGGAPLELLADLPAAGTYQIAVHEWSNLAGAQLVLLDYLTGTRYDLATTPIVTFTVATAGEARGRFALVAGQRPLSAAAPAVGRGPALTVWPNPATGSVSVEGGANEGTPVELLNAIGQVVRYQPAALTTATPISLTGLAPGVYTVRRGAQTRRLVIE